MSYKKKGGSIKEPVRNAIWQILQKFQEKERNTKVLAINKFEEKVRFFYNFIKTRYIKKLVILKLAS